MPSNVRLVQCPKCAKILPEPTRVPLYTCGGCDTILQAKNYKREDDTIRSISHEKAPTLRPSSDGDDSLHHSERNDQNAAETCNGEKSRVGSSSSEATSSNQHHSVLKCKDLSQSASNGANVKIEKKEQHVENGYLDGLRDADSESESSSSTVSHQLRHQGSFQLVAANGVQESNTHRYVLVGANGVSEADSDTSSLHEHAVMENEELVPASIANVGLERSNVGDRYGFEQVRDVNSAPQDSPSSASFAHQNKECLGNGEVERSYKIEAETSSMEQTLAVRPNHQYSTPSRSSLELKKSLDLEIVDNGDQNKVHNENLEKKDQVGNAKSSIDDRLIEEPAHCVIRESLALAAMSKEVVERDNGIAAEFSSLQLVGNENSSPHGSSDDVARGDGIYVECSNLERVGDANSSDSSADPHFETKDSSRLPAVSKIAEVKDDVVAVNCSHLEQTEPSKLASAAISVTNSCQLEKELSVLSKAERRKGNVTGQYNQQDSEEQLKEHYGNDESGNQINQCEIVEVSNVVHEEALGAKYHLKPTTRQFSSYDSCVSSFEGHDDQVMDRNLHPSKENPHGPNHVEYLDGNEDAWDNFIPSSSEIQQPQKDSSCATSQKAIHPTRGHPRGDRRRSDGEFSSRHSFYRRNSHVPYGSSTSSNYVHEEFNHRLMRPPPSYVYEDRRLYPEACWREEFPMYMSHGTSGEIYHDIYHGYSRGSRAENYQQSLNHARRPYSGETTAVPNIYRLPDPYLRHHPEDVRWAPNLPPQSAGYYGRSLRGAHTSHRSCDLYESYPASPPCFVDTESYGLDILSDDQRHKDDMRRRYLRKKNHPTQQYVRPRAGGAPFITCYLCTEVLQLPSDFLLFKRRCHRLKCGACSGLLKFSVENGRYLVPYYVPDDMAKHIVMTENDAAKNQNPGLDQRASYRNSSAGGSGIGSVHNGEINVESSSEGQGRERSRNEVESSKSKGKKKVEPNDAAAVTSIQTRHAKVTQEPLPKSNSPLHRLMGYASPSQVLYRSSSMELDG